MLPAAFAVIILLAGIVVAVGFVLHLWKDTRDFKAATVERLGEIESRIESVEEAKVAKRLDDLARLIDELRARTGLK